MREKEAREIIKMHDEAIKRNYATVIDFQKWGEAKGYLKWEKEK